MQTPEHPKTLKREARLAFRLPLDVAEAWRNQAKLSGLSLSDFVRAGIDERLKSGIATPSKNRNNRIYKTADPELLRQIAWIGNNVNQLARYVNSSKRDIEAVQLLAQLQSISTDLKGILNHAD